jgi:hypothetical protein
MKTLVEKTPFITPFLIGLYAVLGLLAWNISEAPVTDALRPLLVTVAVTFLVLLIVYLLTRNIQLASVITSILLLLFFTYGHVYTVAKSISIDGVFVGRHRYLLLIWGLISVLLIFLFLKKPALAAPAGKYLTLVFSLLIALSLFQTGYSLVRRAYYASTYKSPSQTEIALSPGQEPPDIYYIVLDAYGRSDVLKNIYGVDNSDFINGLKSQGFFVASCGQSNYMHTILSLATTFNMNYLDTLDPAFVNGSPSDLLLPYLKHSQVREMLTALGYKTVVFQNTFGNLTWNDASIVYKPDKLSAMISPFEGLLLRTTAVRAWVDNNTKASDLTDKAVHRNETLYILNKLPDVPNIKGPKFVFVHLIIPHPPFVLGPNGESIDIPHSDPGKGTYSENDYKRGYSDSILYIDQRMKEIIPQLIEKSKVPPIIVIAGDHGPAPIGGEQNSMRNLNAYYLQGKKENLYSSITPVNTFRIIFDSFFNGHYDLLPDKSYFSKYGSFYNLEEVKNDCR